ncbi:MAG TPA: hypothetical protein VN969_39950, partial [Streptosporangiaceae bacterium]|nr:hypothetical protein [Streptosporangiaceae bacterium]
GFPAAQPLYVAQGYDFSLPEREFIDGRKDPSGYLRRDHLVVHLVSPRFGRRLPGPARVKTGSVDDGPHVGHRYAPVFPDAGADGPVNQDAKEPGAERRAALEPADTAEYPIQASWTTSSATAPLGT